jgi:DNA-binding PadR family transcriptional regulator
MHSNDFGGNFAGFRSFGGGHRARRGDMGPIILRALQEKPMHGYEIISHLEEKSHGMWRPSAGSVYPNLQLLEEQDLVTSKSEDGKKIYSLTDTGKEAAVKAEESHKAHWEEKSDQAKNFKELKVAFFEVMGLLRQIATQDSEEKSAEVRKILGEARDKLAELVDKG